MSFDRPQSAAQGPIYHMMAQDHARLDQLLDACLRRARRMDPAPYDGFRRGLLKHIGMEEKILLPATQQLNGGEPLPMAARLRLDHGAIAALLVPSPSPAIVAALKTILAAHNELEEGAGGCTRSAIAWPRAKPTTSPAATPRPGSAGGAA